MDRYKHTQIGPTQARSPLPRRRGASRVKAKALAASDRRPLLALIAFALLAAATLIVTSKALGATPQEKDLEVKVWTADDHELPAVEQQVVHLLQVDPHSAFAHHLLSYLEARTFARDPSDLYLLKQASDLAQQAIDLAPSDASGYVAMANILDMMGNAERAIQLLNEAEAHGVPANNWRFTFTRARLIGGDGASDKVLGLLDKALGQPEAEPRIVVPYVVALLQAENSGQQLIDKLETWNRHYPSILFQLTTAIAYADLGKTSTAHTLYGRIMQHEPDNKEAKVNDAILLYRDMKDAAKAETLLKQVLADHPADLPQSMHAMVVAHLGAAELQRHEWDAASNAFSEAMSIDQDNPGVLDFINRKYKEAKAQDKLVALLHRLNDSNRGSGILYALLGETLSESLHRHDDALKAFADAITLDPERSDYYNGMGLAYYRKKAYGEALKLFVSATEIDPNDATARYNAACVLSLMGKKSDAINSLAEAITLDPRLAQTARGDADFTELKTNMQFKELVQETGAVELGKEVGH